MLQDARQQLGTRLMLVAFRSTDLLLVQLDQRVVHGAGATSDLSKSFPRITRILSDVTIKTRLYRRPGRGEDTGDEDVIPLYQDRPHDTALAKPRKAHGISPGTVDALRAKLPEVQRAVAEQYDYEPSLIETLGLIGLAYVGSQLRSPGTLSRLRHLQEVGVNQADQTETLNFQTSYAGLCRFHETPTGSAPKKNPPGSRNVGQSQMVRAAFGAFVHGDVTIDACIDAFGTFHAGSHADR